MPRQVRDPQSQVVGTVSATLFAPWIALGRATKIPVHELHRVAGVSAEVLADPEERLGMAALFRLVEHVMRTLDDPAVPIRLAAATRIEDLHVMGFLIMTSPTGRDAIDRAIRYSGFISDSGRWSTIEQGDLVEVQWHRAGERTLGHRICNEHAIGAFLNTMRAVAGVDFECPLATFRHAAPRDLAAHERFFRGPIAFDAEHDAFRFPRYLLDLAPRMANSDLNAFLTQQADERLAQVDAEVPISARVQDAIARELPSGPPSMVQVAKRLGVSERTLRRALEEESTSFRVMIEQVRRTRAEQLLAQRRASIGEIAFLLGFSDASAFSRAFRRWSGKTPKAFRETN